jgi:WD40 repeat protein
MPNNPNSAAKVRTVHPFRRWRDHSEDIVDLSWNMNHFLLSASIDKTVRLWHVSR